MQRLCEGHCLAKLAEECCGVSCLGEEGTFPVLPEGHPLWVPPPSYWELGKDQRTPVVTEPDRLPSRWGFSQKEKEKGG